MIEDGIPKARDNDFLGRWREIVADPINLLIRRDKWAGFLRDGRIVLANGNRVPPKGAGSYYGTFGQILVINRGVHEPLEEFVFQETLKVMPEAPLMIELGAYWSHYSMWMMKARPAARTIMVEPERDNLEGGRSNFAANGYEGEFIQAFVGPGAWQLDDFVAARGLSHVDLLHADIQGYELAMLEAGAEALRRRLIDYVFISTHGQDLHRSVCRLLQTGGYRIEAQSDFVESTSFDGFVFAASPAAKPVFDGLEPYTRQGLAVMSVEERLARLDRIRAAVVNR